LALSVALADGTPLPAWLTYANGRVTGQPPANFNGALDLRVTATDGTASASDVFRLTVTPVNDAPVVVAPYSDVSVAEDMPVDIAIPASAFSDVDGDPLTLSVTLAGGSPLPGWLTFANGRLTGQPPAQFHGALDIAVTASDGAASASDTFRLTVSSVNDAPVAVADSGFSVTNDSSLTIAPATLLANDSDPDGDTLTLTAVSGATGGTVSLTGGQVVFTPTAGFTGAGGFTYTVSDGDLSASASVSITVNAPAVNVINGTAGDD